VLEAAAGNQTALVLPDSGERISYAALREMVMNAAATLKNAWIGRHDRVALALSNPVSSVRREKAAIFSG
jgi:acyl-coenzyme A synthetase/AMP-(fatty) acid ligase